MDLAKRLREVILLEFGSGVSLEPKQRHAIIVSNEVEYGYEFLVPNKTGDYIINVDIDGLIYDDKKIKQEGKQQYYNEFKAYMDNLTGRDVKPQPLGVYLSINFLTKRGRYDDRTNKGDMVKIISTITNIVKIVKGSLEDKGYNLQMLMAQPSYNDKMGEMENDSQRKRIYTHLFNRNLPEGFESFESGKTIGIIKVDNLK